MDFGLQKYSKLKNVIDQVAKIHGFLVEDFSLVPGQAAEDSPVLRISFKVEPEAFLSSDDKKELDTQRAFEKIIMNMGKEDSVQKIQQEISQEIKKWMDND